tara:strand:+ start:317 stop:571 length:255 start_codon:yes stop_codon:yes gene_type:complete
MTWGMNCQSEYKAAIAGAVVSVTPLNRLLPQFPVPVHAIAAGVLTEGYCQGRVLPAMDRRAGWAAAYGYLGGAAMWTTLSILGA